MRLKRDMSVRVIQNKPASNQDLIDMNKYIDKEFKIIDYYQNIDSCLNNGEIQINIPGEGIVILNKGEYEVV